MARIRFVYGSEYLAATDLSEADRQAAIAKGDAAIELLARRLGHSLRITPQPRSQCEPYAEVRTRTEIAPVAVEHRIAERFIDEWDAAVRAAIEA